MTQAPEEGLGEILKPLRVELKGLDFTQLMLGSRKPPTEFYRHRRETVTFHLWAFFRLFVSPCHVKDVNSVFSIGFQSRLA